MQCRSGDSGARADPLVVRQILTESIQDRLNIARALRVARLCKLTGWVYRDKDNCREDRDEADNDQNLDQRESFIGVVCSHILLVIK